jgi:hypothetical protein
MKVVQDRTQMNGDTAIVVDRFTIRFFAGARQRTRALHGHLYKATGQWRALSIRLEV